MLQTISRLRQDRTFQQDYYRQKFMQVILNCLVGQFWGGVCWLSACCDGQSLLMSSCKANFTAEGERVSRMAVLLVNCTFTALMALAPVRRASSEMALPLTVTDNRKRINVVRLRILSRCRGLPLVGCWLKMEKRRNLYLSPSYVLRLLALPFLCRMATQKPTLVYAINVSGRTSCEILCRIWRNYISTGIYRCSILDSKWNFARISERQEPARINAFLL